MKGIKRHPNVEDDVVIYAGATILGGNTTIGRASTTIRPRRPSNRLGDVFVRALSAQAVRNDKR